MTRIRAARRDDAAAIGRIHVDTWRDAYAGLLPDRVLIRMSAEIESGRWARSLERGERTLVAESEAGEIVGFGSCGASRSASLSFAGEVYTLYVWPDFQGQGIGRRLLRGLFDALAATGHESAVIWVLQTNPARYFYEAMGGRHVADRDEHLWGAPLTESAYGWDRLSAACPPR